MKDKKVRDFIIRVDEELNKIASTKRKEDLGRLCSVVADPKDVRYTAGIMLGINLGRKIYDARQSIFKVSAHGLDFYYIEALEEVQKDLDLCRDLSPETNES